MSAEPGNGAMEPSEAVNGYGPANAEHAAAGGDRAGGRHPEIAVGAAFAGGLLLAMLLRRVRS